jgi:predicted enzyme related to lactoylglutathione lyase
MPWLRGEATGLPGLRTANLQRDHGSRLESSSFRAMEDVKDEPYYVGFQVNGTDIGLDPDGHKGGGVVYYHVDDIKSTLQTLVDAGAEVDTDVKDVGGGRQIAAVKDAGGNLIGLLQDA